VNFRTRFEVFATVCGLGRILGYIGGKPVGPAMSQPGSMAQDESGQGRLNGRVPADVALEAGKADLSNGFEGRGKQSRAKPSQVANSEAHPGQKKPSVAKNQIQPLQPLQQQQQQQQQQHVEERSASVPVILAHQPYHDNIVIDRVQYLAQATAQTIPVHAAQFAPEYIIAAPGESLQYSQIHNSMYNPSQAQYLPRDLSMRDSALYAQNVTLAAAQAGYVQQVSQGQMSSTTAQPTPYYTSKGIPLPPSIAAGYVHFGPPIHYGQYPQPVLNPTPYNSQQSIYPQQYNQQAQQQQVQQQQQHQQQPSSAQHSPNPQRFSQELAQYQGQPIIQPIAQNVGHALGPCNAERSSSRGPKPMVPPRGNSKITHESGHRKSASLDVPAGPKSKAGEGGAGEEQTAQDLERMQHPENQDKRYLVTGNQTPRTRQDGLYVEANGTESQEAGNPECGIYVSRSEHRKSVSVDAANSFPRRNDSLTFSFPCDNSTQQDSMVLTGRKPIASVNIAEGKAPEASPSTFPAEQRRYEVNSGLRMSPMPVLPPLAVVPKGILASGDRKSVEWSNLSPSQRIGIPQESRRSDYLEDHRRSPMTIDGKRYEEIRRSPMAFIPIRDTGAPDRISQKSPNSLMASQNFEKTRADLAMWKEQRQRQEMESRMMQTREMFSTSPRSRNSSEERRAEAREGRMSAFQPIANISQSSIMEQRRHLRHVSADLTKHMELSRKEIEDQQLSGSVVNVGATPTANQSTSTSTAMSQRSSPNVCYQHPGAGEGRAEAVDLKEAPPPKPLDQVDHIIHSHRKSQALSTPACKGQDGTLGQSEPANGKSDPQQTQCQQLVHNQQSIDLISEKLSQCERQQSDLQAKLHNLQSQNEILDKVAHFQYQQSDLQTRMHNLQMQNQLAEKLSQKQNSEFSQMSSHSDQDETNKSILNQCINASRHLYQQSLLTTVAPQLQSATGYFGSDRVSPRLQFQQQQQQQQQQQNQEEADIGNSIQIPNISQMPLPSLSQFDRADVLPRGSHLQHQRGQSANDSLETIPCSQMSLASLATLNFTGTLKKVPPEKPPRTSLIVQSPDAEVKSLNVKVL
jgi:hypothetical protein